MKVEDVIRGAMVRYDSEGLIREMSCPEYIAQALRDAGMVAIKHDFETRVQAAKMFIESVGIQKAAEFLTYQEDTVAGLTKNLNDYQEQFLKYYSLSLEQKP